MHFRNQLSVLSQGISFSKHDFDVNWDSLHEIAFTPEINMPLFGKKTTAQTSGTESSSGFRAENYSNLSNYSSGFNFSNQVENPKDEKGKTQKAIQNFPHSLRINQNSVHNPHARRPRRPCPWKISEQRQ